MSKKSRGIQSVDIGFRVLASLAADRQPSTLGAVAKQSELSPSQAHRYLASLIASGMAYQNPASGLYDLGPQAIQIGLAALSRTDVFAEADPVIAEFTRVTGRTVLLAARGPQGPTIVRWHAGRSPVITSLAVGSTLPLLGSATGHAFLSFMSPDELAGELKQNHRSLTRSEMSKLNAIRKRVRTQMVASVDELLIPGLRAAAVPILDIQGRAVLVATVIATPAFSRKEDSAIVKKLQTACKSLTNKLGASWK